MSFFPALVILKITSQIHLKFNIVIHIDMEKVSTEIIITYDVKPKS